MVQIKTVLCPVDFSSLSDDELQIAIEICEAFDARLVLHHNLSTDSPVLSKSWEWADYPAENWTRDMAEKAMQAVLDKIPNRIQSEVRISEGLVVPVLFYLVETLPADLVILGSHGWSSEDHTSIADRIIEWCPSPVLTIREGEGHCLRLRPNAKKDIARVLIPTDFSESADKAMQYAFQLARALPMHLELFHVAPPDLPSPVVPIDNVAPSIPKPGSTIESARQRLCRMVPEDLAERVVYSVEVGAAADKVVEMAERVEPHFIVMGRHARGLLRRFTEDTSLQLVHRSHCPVWFPAAAS